MTQIFQIALHNLLMNKVRFFQCILALMVGVAGVVVVLALGFGLLNVNEFFFDQYAPGLLNCYVEQNAAYPKAVGPSEMEQLASDNPEVIAAVSPFIWSSDLPLNLRNGDRVYKDAKLCGVNESYILTYNNVYIQEGRFLQTMDIYREQKVCVVGKDIADTLFEGDALSKELKIWGESYRVVGVLSDSPLANYDLLIPYTSARKIYGERIDTYDSNKFYVDRYFVVANSPEQMSEARQLLEDMLRRKTGGETGSVYGFGTRWSFSAYGTSATGEIMKGSIFFYFLWWLLAAGALLLIGCVGIMNVMLASVRERTLEIALRRAFGATNNDIQRQFTLESVATSLIGGTLGVALGLGVVVIMAVAGVVLPLGGGYQVCFKDMNCLTLGLPILAALASCVGIGVLAASYPAQQAVKMEIVDAINSD